MCHDTTAAPIAKDADLVAYLRTVKRSKPDRDPLSRSDDQSSTRVNAIDTLTETRAMVGLGGLAAEGLPAPHSTEFIVLFETILGRLDTALDALRRDADPLPASVEA